MTDQQLIEVASECGKDVSDKDFDKFEFYPDQLAKFAERIAAREREANAQICEQEICNCCWGVDGVEAAEHIAETIRARGEK